MTDVLVVGGGPAGLAASLAAARTGRSVTLVEAGNRLGGMAASHEVAGQRVDLGSHRLHVDTSPRVEALLRGLLGDDLQERTRNGRLLVHDRWVDFPFSTTEMLRALGPRVGASMVRDLATAPLRRPRADTYAEVIRSGLGPVALDTFHGPMATKLWGVEPEHLAGALAHRRISVRSPLAVVRRMLRTSRPSGRRFRYPRLGYGQITERLAEEVEAHGVTLLTGARVDGLHPGAEVGVELVDRGIRRVETVSRVFWTAPLADLAACVDGAPDAAAADHRGMVLVYAVVPGPRWRPVDAHYVPVETVPFSRISEPKQYRDGPDPADRSVLCLEVPCTPGDRHWEADPQWWLDRLDDDLARIGLPATRADEVELVRLPRVYPLIRPGDVERRRWLVAWSHSLAGVTTLGRQGLHVGDNLHHVLDMGLTAGTCWRRDGGWDDDAWTVELGRFDTFVVED